jgi:hypothetical protein
MSAGHEIDYEALIDRLIKDFRPAQRLWPAGRRLICWILFEVAILILAVALRGYGNLPELSDHPERLVNIVLLFLASNVAASVALKSAVPGREVTVQEMGIAIAIVAVALGFKPDHKPGEIFESLSIVMPQLFSFAALPWLCLFWAVRRGVPLQPEFTGAAAGVAAFCLAATLWQIINGPMPDSAAVLALCCTVVIVLSALAGRLWLNWIARWRLEGIAGEFATRKRASFGFPAGFPLTLAAATALLIFVLKAPGTLIGRVPEFDLAIESYEQALGGFHPNVPSTSMDTMLTAYVEHGMPAYMWDFSAQGFKLVGGRWELPPDGEPITYTWFRGGNGGVMCIFKQIETFNPPRLSHDEHHQLLFYRYRDFSFCLINVGGYGNFISVIAAPIPLKQFEHLVLAVTL